MRKKLVHYALCGLDYIYLEDVPVRRTVYGEVIETDMAVIERSVAAEIVSRGLPLRGAEVQFLRKSLGFSLARFGEILGYSAPAILKWERARFKRLLIANEVAVRALAAEKLGISMEGKLSVLKGAAETPDRVVLRVA